MRNLHKIIEKQEFHKAAIKIPSIGIDGFEQQCLPRSDCSKRSNVIRVSIVCHSFLYCIVALRPR